MLEIKVSGESRTGKTKKLMEMAERELKNGGRVLYVAPSYPEATDQINVHFALKDKKPDISSAANLHRELSGRYFDLIIFDETKRFGSATPEGSQFALACSRLRHLQFGTLAYSTTDIGNEIWVSTSVWYKPWTWGKGYFLIG